MNHLSNSARSITHDGEMFQGAARLYLDLMKRCLTNSLNGDREMQVVRSNGLRTTLLNTVLKPDWHIVEKRPYDPEKRANGRDWPASAETMIGLKRLDNLQRCVEDILHENVPGDLIETGVWRGGATIFMRACLKVYGANDRTVWVADSFEGLPVPDPAKYPADAGDIHHTYDELRVSLDEVKSNFARYGLLDNNVRFLKGWFRDTLQEPPIERLAILRLDGDMYESTMDVLRALYSRLSVGGCVIVDDYGAVKGCRLAVDDFRKNNGINDPLTSIDWTGVFWKRTR